MDALQLPLADQFVQTAYQRTPYGPSSKSICRVLNSGTCGSGTVVGKRNGKTLVLTNAHVAGTKIGRVVVCEFPWLNTKRINARVIMAAYSDRVMMDWAILEIDEDLPLTPTKLSKKAPSGDHYTGGYPKCQGPWYQRLTTRTYTHGGIVMRWQPISIGGQSGSGVHAFSDNLQYALLTWSWAGDGAGQTSRGIYYQYAQRAAVGLERPDDLIELCSNVAEDLENGFFAESSIVDLPIWHDDTKPDDPPSEPPSGDLKKAVVVFVASMKKSLADLEKAVDAAAEDGAGDPGNDDDATFGL